MHKSGESSEKGNKKSLRVDVISNIIAATNTGLFSKKGESLRSKGCESHVTKNSCIVLYLLVFDCGRRRASVGRDAA